MRPPDCDKFLYTKGSCKYDYLDDLKDNLKGRSVIGDFIWQPDPDGCTNDSPARLTVMNLYTEVPLGRLSALSFETVESL